MTRRPSAVLRRALYAVRVRTLLVAAFGALLVATVGLTSWLLVDGGDRIVRSVIALAAEDAHDDIEREARRFLHAADVANAELALSWAAGRIDLADERATLRLLEDIVEIAPAGAISTIGLGFPDGRFVGIGAEPSRWPLQDWRYAVASGNTGGRLVTSVPGVAGELGRTVEDLGAYDPTIRPWYRQAVAADGAVWTDVYLDFELGMPTVSRAVAIRDADDEVVAVAITDLLIRHLQRFLEGLPLSEHSEAFVVLPDRRVLAAWSPASGGASIDDPRPGVPLLGAGMPASLDRVGEEAAAMLSPDDVRNRPSPFPGGTIRLEAASPAARHVVLHDDPGFLLSTRLDDGLTPRWTLGAFVPERDYLQSVPEVVRRVLPLALLVLATALASVVGFATLVSRPLARLGESAARLAGGDFESPVSVRVRNEVGRLAGALEEMRRRLGASFAALDAERERSRATLDAIGDAVIMVRADRTVALMNRAAERLTGRRDGEARGQPVRDVVRAREASGGRPFDARLLDEIAAGPDPAGTVLALDGDRGRARPVRLTVSPLGGDATGGGAVLVLAELSEVERSRGGFDRQASRETPSGPADRVGAERRDAGASPAPADRSATDAGAPPRDVEAPWLERLDAAIEGDRLELWVQRIAAADGGASAPTDAEVLVRLREPDGSLVLPGAFLPAAERHGVTERVDRAVIDAALGALGAHPAFAGAVGTLWINLSGRTLGHPSALGWIEGALDRHGIDPARVGFEVGETAAVARLPDAEPLMRALRGLGCRVALDDFGAGASSFHQVRTLPLDVLKIDGGLVRRMCGDARDRALVASVHALAWSFGLETVAEHVEDERTRDELRAIGVDRLQGFLIDRPRPLLELLDGTAAG